MLALQLYAMHVGPNAGVCVLQALKPYVTHEKWSLEFIQGLQDSFREDASYASLEIMFDWVSTMYRVRIGFALYCIRHSCRCVSNAVM